MAFVKTSVLAGGITIPHSYWMIVAPSYDSFLGRINFKLYGWKDKETRYRFAEAQRVTSQILAAWRKAHLDSLSEETVYTKAAEYTARLALEHAISVEKYLDSWFHSTNLDISREHSEQLLTGNVPDVGKLYQYIKLSIDDFKDAQDD